MQKGTEKSAIVIGGGVAGMSAACSLAEAGLRVQLVERRNYLGGRASSYLHPGVNEVIDNCQHVLFGCCTNLIGFYERIGVERNIHWTRNMTMIEPGGRESLLGPSWLPAPLHGLPKLLTAKAFTRADKMSLARAFWSILRLNPKGCPPQGLGDWLRRNGQTQGAIDRFWRLVIASALNADVDVIALPYAAKVIRELFLNSAQAGAMGMSSVPLSELYAGAQQFLKQRGGEVIFNAGVDAAEWDEETSQWTLATRAGVLVADYLVIALPFEATAKLMPHMPPADGAEVIAGQIERHEHGPICSLHLWFDREITPLEHAVLLDREIHWMYNKSRLQPWRKTKGSY
ncbi:MAG: hydroxysqualene dehydroxylase HpnE, partial [Terracidiphilus sp.]